MKPLYLLSMKTKHVIPNQSLIHISLMKYVRWSLYSMMKADLSSKSTDVPLWIKMCICHTMLILFRFVFDNINMKTSSSFHIYSLIICSCQVLKRICSRTMALSFVKRTSLNWKVLHCRVCCSVRNQLHLLVRDSTSKDVLIIATVLSRHMPLLTICLWKETCQ